MTATPALLSRWRETMKPLSRNSVPGSMATMSPMSMPSLTRSRRCRAKRVDPQLDMVPADRLRVDLVVEGVARGLERQDGAAIGAALGEDGAARAFGEARRPVADRHELEPAVVLERFEPGRRACRDARRWRGPAGGSAPGRSAADGAAAGELDADSRAGRARRRPRGRWCRCSRSGSGSRAARSSTSRQ